MKLGPANRSSCSSGSADDDISAEFVETLASDLGSGKGRSDKGDTVKLQLAGPHGAEWRRRMAV